MHYVIEAACSSRSGKVRTNNEDNFYFDGRCLEVNNTGLSHCITATKSTEKMFCLGVFDGIGGKNYGEYASYTAAKFIQQKSKLFSEYVVAERDFLNNLCIEINDAILKKGQELCTNHIGTTAGILLFSQEFVYACNIGDSRVYRFRDGVLLQLSIDHIEERVHGSTDKKAPLSQYLGIQESDFQIEPYIAKGGIQKGDQYLICSDGLTDMLTDADIRNILSGQKNPSLCVDDLIRAAIENGGKDNITMILCNVI